MITNDEILSWINDMPLWFRKATSIYYQNDVVTDSDIKGGIPFSVTVPKPPVDIDASQMTEAQLHAKLQRGYDDYTAGRTQNAADAFAKFRESHVLYGASNVHMRLQERHP